MRWKILNRGITELQSPLSIKRSRTIQHNNQAGPTTGLEVMAGSATRPGTSPPPCPARLLPPLALSLGIIIPTDGLVCTQALSSGPDFRENLDKAMTTVF